MSTVDHVSGRGPRVPDDMTVEVALALMAGAGVDYLTVCDEDDQCKGLITLFGLTVLRESAMYTDRIRLRDVLGGSLHSPGPRTGGFGEYGRVPGVLGASS
ncbi:CBS domain-containing protein [Streptomyces sp. NPDC059168]|uniref:CBS domain-containing protein n=1 Tax=Streptomyces sp. NPDC059168 TaxID=3346753 RepID=UPI0036A4ABC8